MKRKDTWSCLIDLLQKASGSFGSARNNVAYFLFCFVFVLETFIKIIAENDELLQMTVTPFEYFQLETYYAPLSK